jgi:integrase/recombinase XerD
MNLNVALTDYLSLRRSLGYKLTSDAKALKSFVGYLEQHGLDHITTVSALQWARQTNSKRPYRWSRRLCFVRGFACYLSALDRRTEIPSSTLLQSKYHRPTPFMITAEHIDCLLQGALNRPRLPTIVTKTLHCLYGLLSVTGLRISEALKLTCQDIDFDSGVLTINHSKFGKSRLVPLQASSVKMLRDYQHTRQSAIGNRHVVHWFINQYGKPIGYDSVRYHFRKIFQVMGHQPQPGRANPRLHDLRHYFAVSTITRWYEDGADVHAKLPILSAYLGHVETRDTYWYISACPNLMLAAAQRLENNNQGGLL